MSPQWFAKNDFGSAACPEGLYDVPSPKGARDIYIYIYIYTFYCYHTCLCVMPPPQTTQKDLALVSASQKRSLSWGTRAINSKSIWVKPAIIVWIQRMMPPLELYPSTKAELRVLHGWCPWVGCGPHVRSPSNINMFSSEGTRLWA